MYTRPRFIGQRLMFVGAFERTGTKRNRKKTVLLKHVAGQQGNPIADHLWFNFTKGFEGMRLRKGQFVQFSATVASYRKRWLADYKLERQRQISLR